MSYVAHYPLVKDSNDVFGHAPLTTNNFSAVVADGILGGCYEITGFAGSVTLPEIIGKKTLSIAFWIKVGVGTLPLWSDIFKFNLTEPNGPWRLEVSNNHDSDVSVSLNLFNNGTWTGDGGIGDITFNRNERHHLVITSSETHHYLYLDGALVRKHIKDKGVAGELDPLPNFNGSFSLGDGGANFKIYDLQIYSHTLSFKEVQQVYKTCVLDWTFSSPLITGTNLYSGRQHNAAEMVVEYDVATDIFKDYGFDTATKFSSTPNTAHKLSYSYLCPTDILTKNNYGADVKLNISYYIYASTDVDAVITLQAEQSSTFSNTYVSSGLTTNSATLIQSSTKGQVVFVQTTLTPNSSGAVYVMHYFNRNQANVFTHGYFLVAGVNVSVISDGVKRLEAPDILTSSGLLGKISDASGWGNDSISYGRHLPQLTTDTNIGRYAYLSKNTGGYIELNCPLNTQNVQGTFEFWVKLESSHHYTSILGRPRYGSSGLWFALKTEGSDFWFYNGAYYRSTWGLKLHEWVHMVAVLEGTSLTWYANGEKRHTIDNNRTFTSTPTLRFGGDWQSDYPWDTRFDGKISCMRIYAKCLSPEEIASLYKNTNVIKVDQRGGVHASHFTEDKFSNNKLFKSGKVISQNFTELKTQDMPIKVMSDGSAWARIFYHLPKNGTVLFKNADEALHINTPEKYSMLYLLEGESLRSSSGEYEFLLEYPQNAPGQYNRWKQTSNPCTSNSVTGYVPIHEDWTANYWGGLLRDKGTNTFIRGSVTTDDWYYAIGCYKKWDVSIPGSNFPAHEVCLYIRIDNCNLINTTENNSNPAKIASNYINSSNFDERGY